MAEASEQAVEIPVVEVPATEQEAEAPVVEQAEDQTEREPGGKDPLEIARRIEFGKRKAAEERAKALQEENTRLQERARMLEEQANKPASKQAEPELTIERVEQAIRDGSVDPVIGQRWIARKEAELFYQAQEQKRTEAQTKTRIEGEINAYMTELPALRDRASKEFQAAQVEFSRLVTEFGYDKDDPRTYHTAIRMAHGPLEKFQKQREADRMTRETLRPHTEAPSGGTREQTPRVDISKAPEGMKSIWDTTGVSQADRLKEYQIYLKRQGGRTQRAGK